MVQHHPDDEQLLSLAWLRLPPGATVVVSVHLEYCPECRARVRTLQAISGELLELAEPQPLAPDALASTLQRLGGNPPDDSGAAATPEPSSVATSRLSDVPSLESLRHCKVSRWYWVGPGRRLARVRLISDGSSLFLLKIDPGRSVPPHAHTGLEFTQVLSGSFRDGRRVLATGDFMVATQNSLHHPVAEPGCPCICLVWLKGRLQFKTRISDALRALQVR